MVEEKTRLVESGSTQIDLGTDLLEKPTSATGILKSHQTSINTVVFKDSLDEESANELFKNAKILVSEGFLEDAKKTLHKILVKDPGDVVARQFLNEIYQTELKQILGEEIQIRRPYSQKKTQPIENFDPDLVLRKLDRDLSLGLFEDDGSFRTDPTLGKPSVIFQSPEVLSSFFRQLEKELAGGTVQDWIDLGIAFLEMDLFVVAIKVFKGACNRINQVSDEDKTNLISAGSLLALAYLLTNQPLEALSQLQPMIADDEIKKEDKIELFYLMGKAYEAVNKREVALQFYRQVAQIDAHYRDISKRLIKK